MKSTLTKNVEKLVPHAAPMMLLGKVTEHAGDYIETETLIDGKIPANDGDGVPAYVGIELMAQTIAAYSGVFDAAANRPPQIGFLLGTRRFFCQVQSFANGETLCVRATKMVQYEQFALFACSIKINGKSVAKADVSVFSRGARAVT